MQQLGEDTTSLAPTAVNSSGSHSGSSSRKSSNSTSSSSSSSAGNAKFLALALFCWFTINNGFSWLLFDSVATELKNTFPLMSRQSVYLLSSWQPLLYIVAFYPLTRLQATSSDGLRKAVLVGTTFEFMGAGLKLAATFIPQRAASVYILHGGQILSAVASPVAIGAPASLSAQWFDSRFRTRTTGTAVLSNNIGNAIAYALVPSLSLSLGFQYCIYLEFASAVLLEIVALSWFPSATLPRRRRVGGGRKSGIFNKKKKKKTGGGGTDSPAPASPAQGASPVLTMSPDEADIAEGEVGGTGTSSTGRGTPQSSIGIGAQMKHLFSVKSTTVLCICYAWSSGSYVAWTSLYDALMGGSEQMNSVYIGFVSLSAMLAYVVGGMLGSYVTDLYLRQRMKLVIAGSMLLCAVSAAVFMGLATSAQAGCTTGSTSTRSSFETTTGVNESHGGSNWGDGLPLTTTSTVTLLKSCPAATDTMKVLILVAAAATGAFTGAAAPIFYELLAEISYPVPEVISGNVLSLAENVGSLVTYQGASYLAVGQVNLGFMAGMVLCVVLVVFLVREVHLRPVSGKLRGSAGGQGKGGRSKFAGGAIISQEDDDDEKGDANTDATTAGRRGSTRRVVFGRSPSHQNRGEAVATHDDEHEEEAVDLDYGYGEEEEEEDYTDDQEETADDEEMDEFERHNQPMAA